MQHSTGHVASTVREATAHCHPRPTPGAGDPQAGLTELQRAQRNGQLAAPLAAGATTQHWRPVILDLDGDGIETTDQAHGVSFDVDSSGYFKTTAWAGHDDGFLVLDRNLNGLLDDASELFSNAAVADSAKGIASLRWVDATVDGNITGSDPVFGQLRVWQDKNTNGTVDAGELKSLADLSITALHYARGSYDVAGQTRQLMSPDLVADADGIRTHDVDGGILVESSTGTASLIVTRVNDLANIAPGKDSISNGIEDVTLDIFADDLLRNDLVGGVSGTGLTIAGLSGFRHGTASIDGNQVVHFRPEANYFGTGAGLGYTAHRAANDERWVRVA